MTLYVLLDSFITSPTPSALRFVSRRDDTRSPANPEVLGWVGGWGRWSVSMDPLPVAALSCDR